MALRTGTKTLGRQQDWLDTSTGVRRRTTASTPRQIAIVQITGTRNGLRPHQALGYRTPAEVFHEEQGVLAGEESNRRMCSPGEGIESLAGASELSLNSDLILSK